MCDILNGLNRPRNQPYLPNYVNMKYKPSSLNSSCPYALNQNISEDVGLSILNVLDLLIKTKDYSFLGMIWSEWNVKSDKYYIIDRNKD